MIGTYVSFLLVLGAAALVGQAIWIGCGRREWSRLAPAAGLAALCPLAWWTVRLPGEGTTAIVVLGLVTVLAGAYVAPRVKGLRGALRRGIPIELAAVGLASLPFIVESRFGILGTSLNPDMSQHLFAVDRLASGGSEQLISEGYPLGPHSIVAALSSIGPSTVQAFDGLTLAVAACACLAPLALLESDRIGTWRRVAGALCIGFAYLVTSYLVQGAFKETMQALFLVAFAIGLGLAASGRAATLPRRAGLPLAVLAIGSAYTYSFPGLLWIAGAVGLWGAVELATAWRGEGRAGARAALGMAGAPLLIGAGVVVAAIAPEAGRMVDFANFETFNPAGAGLGNLFNRLSPLEALGIWPSGDFRVEPGDGAVPAIVFYLGAAAGLVALAYGVRWWLRRGERAVPAALAAALLLWLYALIAGTPYQEAKALVAVAALVALISIRALVAGRAPAIGVVGFLIAAGGSSVLALANGPVGPSDYSPALAELRMQLEPGSSINVVAPDRLLRDQHGLDYIAWELRGNRVCIVSDADPGSAPATETAAVTLDGDGAVVVDGLEVNRAPQGAGSCPLIPDAARADPSAGG